MTITIGRADLNSFEHVGVVLTHLRMEWLLRHFPSRLAWEVYVCVNGFITIGILGLRLLAAALSLSATGALMALLRVSHPPAGATTLIVSLGIISQPKELVIIEIAAILLTVQALVINRLAGIPYPVWRSKIRRSCSPSRYSGQPV